jgi:hypothetical protein
MRYAYINDKYKYEHTFTDYTGKIKGIQQVGKISSEDSMKLRRQLYRSVKTMIPPKRQGCHISPRLLVEMLQMQLLLIIGEKKKVT